MSRPIRRVCGGRRSRSAGAAGEFFLCAELSRSLTLPREPLAGTTVHTFPGTPGHLPAWFPQFKCMSRPFSAGLDPDLISPYKRGGAGSNSAAPTKFLQLGGLFETLIGGPVTTAGNHRCMLPDGGRGQGAWIPAPRRIRKHHLCAPGLHDRAHALEVYGRNDPDQRERRADA